MTIKTVAIIVLFLTQLTQGTELALKTVFLPLYVPFAVVGEEGENLHLKPREIEFISRGAEPETRLSMLTSEFIPKHDSSWATPVDANLISRCGLKLSHRYEEKEGKSILVIRLDKSKFKKPRTVVLTDDEILGLVKKAITESFPDSKIQIKK